MYIVSAAVTLDGKSKNRKTCFELNAVNLPDMETAQKEADRRNAVEKAAGHSNVHWYPSEWVDIEILMAKLKR